MNVALTIAGSDSGGGAGIQADLKTFHQFGVFGTSVVTAVTAQNTLGVRAWEALPADLIRQQLDAVAEDLPPGAVKTGMLGSAEVVEVVAEGIARHRLPNYVLDPVMVATSGDRLLHVEAERLIAARLLPLATLVTPNLDEARILVGDDVADVDCLAPLQLHHFPPREPGRPDGPRVPSMAYDDLVARAHLAGRVDDADREHVPLRQEVLDLDPVRVLLREPRAAGEGEGQHAASRMHRELSALTEDPDVREPAAERRAFDEAEARLPELEASDVSHLFRETRASPRAVEVRRNAVQDPG